MMNNIGIIRRRVMQMANALVKKGYCRRLAMLKAWIIIKAEKLSVRVAGVTFKQRQQMLAALDGRQALFIKLRREDDNLFDCNAVSVWVFAEGTRGFFKIGYLPKIVAAVIAPLLDKGENIGADSFRVTASQREGFSLGARFNIVV